MDPHSSMEDRHVDHQSSHHQLPLDPQLQTHQPQPHPSHLQAYLPSSHHELSPSHLQPPQPYQMGVHHQHTLARPDSPPSPFAFAPPPIAAGIPGTHGPGGSSSPFSSGPLQYPGAYKPQQAQHHLGYQQQPHSQYKQEDYSHPYGATGLHENSRAGTEGSDTGGGGSPRGSSGSSPSRTQSSATSNAHAGPSSSTFKRRRSARPVGVQPKPQVRVAPGPEENLTATAKTRSYPIGEDANRPFQCDLCPQNFNRNHDLKRHRKIHLDVKAFDCLKCNKSFSRKDALRRHWLVKGCKGNELSGAGLPTDPAFSQTRPSTSGDLLPEGSSSTGPGGKKRNGPIKGSKKAGKGKSSKKRKGEGELDSSPDSARDDRGTIDEYDEDDEEDPSGLRSPPNPQSNMPPAHHQSFASNGPSLSPAHPQHLSQGSPYPPLQPQDLPPIHASGIPAFGSSSPSPHNGQFANGNINPHLQPQYQTAPYQMSYPTHILSNNNLPYNSSPIDGPSESHHMSRGGSLGAGASFFPAQHNGGYLPPRFFPPPPSLHPSFSNEVGDEPDWRRGPASFPMHAQESGDASSTGSFNVPGGFSNQGTGSNFHYPTAPQLAAPQLMSQLAPPQLSPSIQQHPPDALYSHSFHQPNTLPVHSRHPSLASPANGNLLHSPGGSRGGTARSPLPLPLPSPQQQQQQAHLLPQAHHDQHFLNHLQAQGQQQNQVNHLHQFQHQRHQQQQQQQQHLHPHLQPQPQQQQQHWFPPPNPFPYDPSHEQDHQRYE